MRYRKIVAISVVWGLAWLCVNPLPAQERSAAAAPALLVAPFDGAAARSAQSAWARHLGKRSHEETNGIGMKL